MDAKISIAIESAMTAGSPHMKSDGENMSVLFGTGTETAEDGVKFVVNRMNTEQKTYPAGTNISVPEIIFSGEDSPYDGANLTGFIIYGRMRNVNDLKNEKLLTFLLSLEDNDDDSFYRIPQLSQFVMTNLNFTAPNLLNIFINNITVPADHIGEINIITFWK